MSDQQTAYLRRIHNAFPELTVHTARLHTGEGQFNDIVFVNEEIIFRFPRTVHVAATPMREIALLRALQRRTTLPVPNPVFSYIDLACPDQTFMGYPMLPGEPLWNETLAAIDDEAMIQRIANQIATFLRELHNLSSASLGLDLPVEDSYASSAALYAAFRDQLFPYMRPDARDWITEHFELFLSEPCHFAYQPALRHGDFGTGNILYDSQTHSLSGVIDWSFAGIGDPALDMAAISGCGRAFALAGSQFPEIPADHNTISPSEEAFLQRFHHIYPESVTMLERARFYKGTYALYQALTALRDGDQASFDDGIAAYV